jgi:hypothetical protein
VGHANRASDDIVVALLLEARSKRGAIETSHLVRPRFRRKSVPSVVFPARARAGAKPKRNNAGGFDGRFRPICVMAIAELEAFSSAGYGAATGRGRYDLRTLATTVQFGSAMLAISYSMAWPTRMLTAFSLNPKSSSSQ